MPAKANEMASAATPPASPTDGELLAAVLSWERARETQSAALQVSPPPESHVERKPLQREPGTSVAEVAACSAAEDFPQQASPAEDEEQMRSNRQDAIAK